MRELLEAGLDAHLLPPNKDQALVIGLENGSVPLLSSVDRITP